MLETKPTRKSRVPDATVIDAIEKLTAAGFAGDWEDALESHLTLFRAQAVYRDAVAARMETLGLSVSRFNMLWRLFLEDGHRLTVTTLGSRLEVSAPNVMRMVRALEENGWVETKKSETDRRVTFVDLTSEGEQRFTELVPKALAIYEELWSGLTKKETAQLAQILSKLRQSLLSRYIGGDRLRPYRLEKKTRTSRAPQDGSKTG